MSGMDCRLEDDLTSVAVSFPTTPPLTLNLDANEVDSLLHKLGDLRARLVPEVEADWYPGGMLEVVCDPRLKAASELMEGNPLLHIRDPRFGWLHYMIPREDARRLGQYLIEHADAPLLGPEQVM